MGATSRTQNDSALRSGLHQDCLASFHRGIVQTRKAQLTYLQQHSGRAVKRAQEGRDP